MSVSYRAVGWSRSKRIYDAALLAAVMVFIAAFVGVTFATHPAPEDFRPEAAAIRGLGVCAILLLHAALWIGPLARLDRRLLPLLYNRRHLGVTTFLVGLGHAAFATLYYHGFGETFPLVSLLSAPGGVRGVADLPFEWFGIAALAILFLMAATSHDFWLRNLGAKAWKRLHMLVYAAYAALVAHVAFGAMQSETSPVISGLVLAGTLITCGLHVAAGLREVRRDERGPAPREDGYLDICGVGEIAPDRAKVATIGAARVAIFRENDGLSAISNVCAHQGGPLGEGKVVDGCVTCPWHGWQYRAADGCSPPPFTEKIPTYRVKVEAGRVLVHPEALAPGTPTPPARVTPITSSGAAAADEFYVGYLPKAPRGIARRSATAAAALLAIGAGAAGLAAAAQRSPGPGRWDDDKVVDLWGRFISKPVPMLLTPGHQAGSWRVTLLVNAGKCGAFAPEDSCGPLAVLVSNDAEREGARAEAMRRWEGAWITARGTAVSPGLSTSMLELESGERSVSAMTRPPSGLVMPEVAPLGEATIVGEIVDSKCFLGVMKPGHGRAHRACAARCIAGGIPAAMTAVDPETGKPALVVLASDDGGPLGKAVLPYVGGRVTARGALSRIGETLVLRVAALAR